MRRADIARFSAVTGGADYLSTLSVKTEEGPASYGHRRFPSTGMMTISPLSQADQSLQGHVFRQTSHGVVLDEEPTVISRILDDVSTVSPQMLRCQTTPSM